jgi:histidinol-phosphate phosphatase family protein
VGEQRPALFLDRDGVIFHAPPRGEYLVSWDQCRLADGVAALARHARDRGYLVVVVTNQGQVAKGMLNEEQLGQLHARMIESLGGQVDAVYFCPHTDAHGCDCRKPKPGMLRQAGRDLSIDFSRSIMVGDSDRDILAGSAAGCTTVFVRNEFNAAEERRCMPAHVVGSLEEIARLL